MSNQIETQLEVQLENRDRTSVLLRAILIFPAWIFLSSFANWASDNSDAATWTAGFIVLPPALALIFRGIYPSYALAFNHALLDLSLRVTSYFVLLTDKYPTIEASSVVKTTFPEIDGGRKLNRFLPLIKWFLAIPVYLVGIFYALYALLFVVLSWVNILTNGQMSQNSADVICKVIAYWNRVTGYAFLLVTDEYPGFKL
ncbi:MAG: hypothetical protein RLZZ571_52 [Actinomycetota bacterium]|jgi:hypothetical protein